MTAPGKIAVIACGNPNRSDDGAGQEVLRLLRSQEYGPLPENVGLLDAGTDGMSVMFVAKNCSTLIIIDACRTGAESGAIYEVPGAELEQEPKQSFNLHDFRWDHALFAGRKIYRNNFPEDVTVMLIEAEKLDFGIGISEKVAEAARKVARQIYRLIAARQSSNEAAQNAGPI